MKIILSFLTAVALLAFSPAAFAADDANCVTLVSSNQAIAHGSQAVMGTEPKLDVSRQDNVLISIKIVSDEADSISNIVFAFRYTVDGTTFANEKLVSCACNGQTGITYLTNLSTYNAREMTLYSVTNSANALCHLTNYVVKYVVKKQY